MSWSLSNIDPAFFIIAVGLAIIVYFVASRLTRIAILKGWLDKEKLGEDITENATNEEGKEENEHRTN
jgi:hypothetical protein